MSTFKVTAERLVIHPHPNADALELAEVGLYRAVVAKDAYRTGDWAVYIPEQAILPTELIEELGLVGRLAGPDHNRVKAIRLRSELSQGLACRPSALAGIDLAAAHVDGKDFADHLGITKWVPEVPVHMAGEVMPASDLMPWVDIDNIKRYPDVFAAGERVIATEKVHGSCCLLTYVRATGQVLVTSKGHGDQHLALVESEANLYWRAVRAYDVASMAHGIAEVLGADRVGVFGEVYGHGVQDLRYGHNAKSSVPGYAVFDIAVDAAGGVRWLPQDEMTRVASGALPVVPRLYDGPFDAATILALAEGREQVSGRETCIREGVVVRPAVERYSDVLSGRAIAKAVSAAYLTRKGGTEYE